MTTEVRLNAAASRYEIYVDDALAGIADYQDGPGATGARLFPHTEIDGSRRGQGLGAILVRFALDDTRASGRPVIPACWYVDQFMAEHPEYEDLRSAR